MSNIDELRAAFDGTGTDAEFCRKARNLMPQLLEAVDALEAMRARFDGVFDHPTLVKYGPLDMSPARDMYRLASNALEPLKMSKKKMMTIDEYVEKKGEVCPFCGSTQCDGDGVDIDGGFAYQEVTCVDCGKVRTDTYKLVGCHPTDGE